MTSIAVATAKGSPGATTLALALAASLPGDEGRPVILIEADPDGGSLAARLGLGYEPGLATLATAARRGLDEDTLLAHSQALAGRVRVVPGPAGAARSRAAVGACGERMADCLRDVARCDVVVDVGRAVAPSPATVVASAADVCLLVVRPEVDQVQHADAALRLLEQEGCNAGLLCVGDRPYSPVDVAAHLGAPLLGVVAYDERGAGALTTGAGGERSLRRSMFWRSAADVAAALCAPPAPAAASAERADAAVDVRGDVELEPQP